MNFFRSVLRLASVHAYDQGQSDGLVTLMHAHAQPQSAAVDFAGEHILPDIINVYMYRVALSEPSRQLVQ